MLRSLLIPAVAGAWLVAGAANGALAGPAEPDTFLTYHRAPVTPSRQWIMRFQMGRGFLAADASVAGAVRNESNVVMGMSFLRSCSWNGAAGVQGRVETISCSLPGQTFNVSSWDVQIQYELGRSAVACEPGSLTPYAQLGAGVSFHSAEATAFWPFMTGGGPAGTPTAMQVGASPSLEAALGVDWQANRAIALNLQAGYRRDAPRYRMSVSGEADRSGTLRLSEASLRGGVKFLLGRVNGRGR